MGLMSGLNVRICGFMLIYHKYLDSSLVFQNAMVRNLQWKWNFWSIF